MIAIPISENRQMMVLSLFKQGYPILNVEIRLYPNSTKYVYEICTGHSIRVRQGHQNASTQTQFNCKPYFFNTGSAKLSTVSLCNEMQRLLPNKGNSQTGAGSI